MNRILHLIFPLTALLLASLGSVAVASADRQALTVTGSGWRGGEGTARPRLDAGRPVFSLRWGRAELRRYWDRDLEADLASSNGIELELNCPDPAVIREVTLHFHSGRGWYSATQALTRPGWNLMNFPRSAFSAEDQPAGWDRIDRVRISFWKGAPRSTSVELVSLHALQHSLYVLAPDGFAPASERYAARMARRYLDRLLDGMGLGRVELTRSAFDRSGLPAPSQVLIIPFAANLSAADLAKIKSFTDRGGKLLVFHADSTGLARLMGLRLGSSLDSKGFGQWSRMKLSGVSPLWPSQLHQHAWHLRTLSPRSPGSFTQGVWQDARGREQAHPALLKSTQGYWFTAAFGAGDRGAKQRLLSALLCELDPTLAEPLARSATLRCAQTGPYATPAALYAGAFPGRIPSAAAQLYKQGQSLRERALSAYKTADFNQALLNAWGARSLFDRVYAHASRTPAGEFRGIWDHNGTGLYPGGWEATCERLAEHGINAIFPNLAWADAAHYASEHLAATGTFSRYGDQLKQCLEAAARHGQEVHAWKICLKLNAANGPRYQKYKREGRLARDHRGQVVPWLCPSDPANRALEVKVIRELATRYKVTGIHLDYIRYPDRHTGYSGATRNAFEKELGRKVAAWPNDALPGGRDARAFEDFRADVITSLVREIRNDLRQHAPTVKLSAAVWGLYPGCRLARGQDWPRWLKEDLVDFVVPMNYTENAGQFEEWLNQQLALPATRGKLYPGLGAVAGESELFPDQLLEQINLSRKRKTGGFVIFKLDGAFSERMLPYLGTGGVRSED